MNLRRMKKQELKNALLAIGKTEEDLKGKKRPELSKILEEHLKGEVADMALDNAQEITEKHKNIEQDTEERPTPTDPLWTQYVLGQFSDDEVDGENPRVEGLRRVAEKLLGTIVEEGCMLIDPPSVNNNMRASAKAWVVFANGVRFEALADACPDNVTGEYSHYLSAMADTRAKGRCYRNALKLKRVVSAEEIGSTSVNKESAKAIHTGQITAIRKVCDRNHIDENKLMVHLNIEFDNDIQTIDSDQALLILQELHEMERNKNIPTFIKES